MNHAYRRIVHEVRSKKMASLVRIILREFSFLTGVYEVFDANYASEKSPRCVAAAILANLEMKFSLVHLRNDTSPSPFRANMKCATKTVTPSSKWIPALIFLLGSMAASNPHRPTDGISNLTLQTKVIGKIPPQRRLFWSDISKTMQNINKSIRRAMQLIVQK